MKKILDYFAEAFVLFIVFSTAGSGILSGFAMLLDMPAYGKALVSVTLILLVSTLVAIVAGWMAYVIGRKVLKWKG